MPSSNILRLLILVISLVLTSSVIAQEDKIYSIVNEPARLAICEGASLVKKEKEKCSQQRLLRYITENITYPEAAIADSIQGSVVLRFVVKKNGLVGDAEVLRDIGGGCAEVAMAVIDSIRADSVIWRPGVLDSMFVDSYVTIPVRFRIPKIYDYEIVNGDTIYMAIDEAPSFDGGEMAYNMYVQQNLGYPRIGIDSCHVGDFGVELLIKSDGKAYVKELTDYNQLGVDYEFEAIRMLNRMPASWNPAIRKGNKVPSLYSGRVLFQPPGRQCAEEVSAYDKAVDFSNQGDALFTEGKYLEATYMYTQAMDLVPTNVEHLYKRGLAFIEAQKFEEGCVDIYAAKEHLVYTSMDALLPLFCKDVPSNTPTEEEKK